MSRDLYSEIAAEEGVTRELVKYCSLLVSYTYSRRPQNIEEMKAQIKEMVISWKCHISPPIKTGDQINRERVEVLEKESKVYADMFVGLLLAVIFFVILTLFLTGVIK